MGAGRAVRETLAKARAVLSSAWFGVVVVVGTVGALALLSRTPAVPQSTGRPAGAEEQTMPGFHFRDIQLVGRSKGQRDWELDVAVVRAPRDAKQVEFHLVRRGLVYREGSPYLSITADGGVYYPEQNNFIMRGNVVVARENGDLIRAGELQWNPLTRQVTSTQPVEAKVGDIWFRANRFTVDVETQAMVAAGSVLLVKGNGERLSGETLIYSLAGETWEIQGEAELVIRTGNDPSYVAPGLGGAPAAEAGEGSERR